MALTFLHGDKTFSVGDVVRVHQKIEEPGPKGTRVRTQGFEGMVIAARGEGDNKMFTVRRIGAGRIGIERIFPLASPAVEKVEVLSRGKVRRAKLYFLRGKPAREVAEITKRFSRKKSARPVGAPVKRKAKRKARNKK